MKFMEKALKWCRLEKKQISREEWEKVMYEMEDGDVIESISVQN